MGIWHLKTPKDPNIGNSRAKTLSRDHTNGLCMLKRPDGTYTESTEETCKLLLDTHFPGSLTFSATATYTWVRAISNSNRRLAGRIFSIERVKWAISKFSPYKSPGTDGIFPCFLQQGGDIIVPQLSRIFKSSLMACHVPTTWREVKVVFIPKAGRKSEQLPKSYKPISLSSFFLRTMEKLLDSYVRDTYLLINTPCPVCLSTW
ncbi:uncharacterized protein LOC135950751 [Calliphora vicina]|uniref:uncharacterized protein LOC135950751 n=1 Tax=Calliphora vicina TaxID=7373 RepID=UPI00325BC4BB